MRKGVLACVWVCMRVLTGRDGVEEAMEEVHETLGWLEGMKEVECDVENMKMIGSLTELVARFIHVI